MRADWQVRVCIHDVMKDKHLSIHLFIIFYSLMAVGEWTGQYGLMPNNASSSRRIVEKSTDVGCPPLNTVASHCPKCLNVFALVEAGSCLQNLRCTCRIAELI